MPELFDNKYHFVKDLGSGGFGKVFLAKEERSENLVAIKQLKNEDKAKQLRDIHERGDAAQVHHVPPLARLAAHSQAVRAHRRLDIVTLCAGSSDHFRSSRANGRATHR